MPDSDRTPLLSPVDLRALLDAMPDAVLVLDGEWRCRYANAALESMLRRHRETVLDRPVSEVIRGATESDLLGRLERAAREQRSDVFRWTSPEAGAASVHILPVPDWTALIFRNHVASPLAKASIDERLESRLLHAQRLEVMGRIAGGIAHDFNNLLTVIRSYCEFVAADLPNGSAAQADLNEVMQAANSAAHLTRQILSFGCKSVLEPRLLDVNATVRRIVAMLRRVMGEDIHIDTDFAPTACAVLADPGQLEQVLMNLALNARDAMPDGGVLRLRTSAIVIDTAETATDVTLAPGRYVSIMVEDTGVGISPDSIKRIFEAFFTTKGEGTGLGLAMVMSIVEKLGGDVRVESMLGQGSRFTILLPCLDKPNTQALANADAPGTASTSPPTGTEWIMIVEDELGVRAAVRRMLNRLGYIVSEAASGTEALAVVADLPKPPDLVLIDVIMPGQSGRVVAERLLHRWPSLRVLFMSGYSADELGRRGITIPGALLEKPVTIEPLAHAVRRALDTRGLV